MQGRLAYILVGDHLGQVKKVLPDSGELSLLDGLPQASSSNPIVSIESIGYKNKHLIASKNGQCYLYDSIHDTTKSFKKADDNLNKALSIRGKRVLFAYDKRLAIAGDSSDLITIKQKKSEIKNVKLRENDIALVGIDIPLRIYDVETKSEIYNAEPPEKDWLGIRPNVFVSGLDYVDRTRVVTCSKSDSVIRVYDTKSKPKPIISINIDQTAFNEHADSSRFISVASDGRHSIVAGSNVGQMLAIDLRLNVKRIPKKKLQPRSYKILGGFKGARGASIKDVKIVSSYKEGEDENKVISCCLDRYLRIHNFKNNLRSLDKHVYMNTKPYCLHAVFFDS